MGLLVAFATAMASEVRSHWAFGSFSPWAACARVVSAALEVFDVWANWTAKNREQPAVSIGIVYDQDLIWAKGYGYADLRKIPPLRDRLSHRLDLEDVHGPCATPAARCQQAQLGRHEVDPELNSRRLYRPVITIAISSHTSAFLAKSGTYWNDMTSSRGR
jgi:hypothetical protein